MKVKVKKNSPIIVVTAFTGREYVQHEYRLVPDGCEEEASLHPFLDIEKEQHDPSPLTDVQDKASGEGESDVPPLSSSPDLEIVEANEEIAEAAKDVLLKDDPKTCLAFTQAGKRCKRKSLKNGYCKTHGGGA